MEEKKEITVGDVIKKVESINTAIQGLGTNSALAAGLLHEYADLLRAMKVKVTD